MPVPIVMPIALPRAARRAEPPLAEHRAVGVVVERRRQAQPVVDALAQREVLPAEVRREQHDAALAVERARRADADAEDLGAGRLAPGRSRWRARPAPRAGPPRRWRPPPRASARWPSATHGRSVLGDAADDDVGPAEVNAEYESHHAPPRPDVAATAASDGRDRQLPHAAVMPQRADLRPVRGAGAAGERRVLDDDVPRAARPEPEGRHRRPEDRHGRRPHRRREVQRRGVVGHEHAAPARSAPPSPEPERARRAVGAARAPRRSSGPPAPRRPAHRRPRPARRARPRARR